MLFRLTALYKTINTVIKTFYPKKLIGLISFLLVVTINQVYSQTLQWRNLPNSPFYQNGRLEDVYFLNASTGWAVEQSGSVFATTNGGYDWDTTRLGFSREFRSVGFFDSQTGIIGAFRADTFLYRTTNGGNNWRPITNVPNPVPLGICGIFIVNENVAFACGKYSTPARVVKTTDKGLSWISLPVDTSLARGLVDCHFWTPDSGIVVGGNNPGFSPINAVVLITSNGGNTWQKVYTSSGTGEWSWKISFTSRNVGFVSMQRQASGISHILKTTNGGYNWTEIPFVQYSSVQGMGFVNENTGWIGGFAGPTYETTNGGAGWHLAGWGRNLNRVRFINDTLAYAVGERVYKYSRETVGINLTSAEIPPSFNLYQNYPNPFNPVTRIKFEVPATVGVEHVQPLRLIIYDALGREVSTILDQELAPGSYEVEFNARLHGQGNNLSSGIYFYKLESGNFKEVKRMILLN